MHARMAPIAVVMLATLASAGCPNFSHGSAEEIVQPEQAAVEVAPGVWFQQQGYDFGSNVAWVELGDSVVVFDTAFPKGAQTALVNIRRTTHGKPVKWAVVSHYHYDHTFGAGVLSLAGATVIAHENARRDHLLRNPAQYDAWAADPKQDPRYRLYKLTAPTVTFRDHMELADGEGRKVELIHLGPAHTTGDVFLWVPDAGVLMTGDACDNGPYNYVWDSNTASWIDVLAKAAALHPKVVLPGHGPRGGPEVLDAQRQYFVDLRAAVEPFARADAPLAEALAKVDLPAWGRWGVGRSELMLTHVEHVWNELRGRRRGDQPTLGNVDARAVAWPREEGSAP